MSAFTESVVEDAALAWLEGIGWQIRNAPRSPLANPLPSAMTTGR